MAIQRWDPIRDLLQLQERMNHLFDDVLARSGTSGAVEPTAHSAWRPAVDLFEEPARYVARIDLPGIPPKDVDIEIEGEALTVRGERRMDLGVPKESYLRAERPQGRFTLSLALPSSVERGSIEARHGEGVLEIVLPKKEEDRPTRVKVDVK